MFIYINTKQLERIMTIWKDTIEPLVKTIVNGRPEDKDTKDAVAQLKTEVQNLKAKDTDQDAADVELQSVLTEIVTKLQAGDTQGALTAAKAAQA